ncbi:MAG: tetratricopeptide repeat protein, partial [Candidatus Methanomethylophilaceae archaeon]|nr:tetratricopeptide repeat protein [Candidatus Methanomethylophilaceae archaeon]
DGTPASVAADIRLGKNDPEGAAELMGYAEKAGATSVCTLTSARIALAKGDRRMAAILAEESYSIDPSADGPYEVLEGLQPDRGWADRRMVNRMMSGADAGTGGGPLAEAYRRLCVDDIDGVKAQMAAVPAMLTTCPEYRLLAARIELVRGDMSAARREYLKVCSSTDCSYVFCETAELMLMDGDTQAALRTLQSANGTSLRVLKDRVLANSRSGGTERLLKAVDSYLDSEFSGKRQYLECALILLNSHMPDKAMDVLFRLDSDADVLVLRSKCLSDLNDSDEALKLAKEAVRKDPHDVGALAQRGRMYLRTGRKKKASRDCRKAMEMSDSPEALRFQAEMFIAEGRNSEALEVLGRILSSDPGNTDALLSISGEMGRNGMSGDSVSMFMAALDSNPDHRDIVGAVGAVMESGRYRDARDLAIRAGRRFPGETVFVRLKGNCEYQSGDYASARDTYSEAVRMDPYDAASWHSKGMAEESMGMLDEAESSYDRAVTLDLGESTYWVSKAAVQEKKGDVYGSMESLNRAIELDPSSVLPMARKAVMFERAGRLDEALGIVDIALVSEPGDEDLLELRGRISDAISEKEEVVQHATAKKRSKSSAPIEVRRNAEKVLRRAYITKTPFDDEDLLDSVGLEGKSRDEVLAYLKEELEYGAIDVGSEEYRTMEEASNRAVKKLQYRTLSQSDIPDLASLFMTSGLKDVEDVRLLRAYIRSAMASGGAGVSDERLAELKAEKIKGKSLYDLMAASDLGVHEASALLRQ